MFETVVPETFQARSRKLLYETLPLSVGVHAAAFAIAIVGAAWNVAFPKHSPNVTAAYQLTALPDPPPPPPPPPPKQAVTAPPEKPRPVVAAPPPPPQVLEMAPRTIPDLVPKVELTPPPPPPAHVAENAVPNGSPDGSAEGKIGGQVGGHKGGLVGSLVFPDDGRVYVERDAKLPLVVLQQDYPSYPESARKNGEEDSVLVRYVIGTNGRVKEVTILDHAKNPVFDKSAVQAISEWRFRPLMRDGKPVEVVHELTVFYQFTR